MKMKLALVVASGALVGFYIAALRPWPTNGPARDPAPVAIAFVADAPLTVAQEREWAEEPSPSFAIEQSLTARAEAAGLPTDSSLAASSSKGEVADAVRAQPDAPRPEPTPRNVRSELGGKDLQFLTAALEHGQMQVFLGELAQSRADTGEVKAVGEVLARLQSVENNQILRLAASKGVTLSPDGPPGEKAIAAKLEKLQGPKFDKQLMDAIIAVNEQAVANYEAAATSKDADIKAFVEHGLPLAKEKLLHANRMLGNARRSNREPGFRGVDPSPPGS